MTGVPQLAGEGRTAWADPGDFEVVTVALPPGPDDPGRRSDAAERGRLVAGRNRTVAAMGAAAVLTLPLGLDDPAALEEAVSWLGALGRRSAGPGAHSRTEHEPPRALALGAFAFDRSAPASLVVPATAWCADASGGRWVVHVVRRGEPVASLAPPPPTGGAAGGAGPVSPVGATAVAAPRVRAVGGAEWYPSAVSAALGDIAAGRLRKVVLARSVDVDLDAPPASEVLRRLWDADSAFYPFSVPVPGGRLVGASPELLVSRRGATVASHAFAGTVALDGTGGDDRAIAQLVASAKDQAEHRLVVDEIAAALRRRCAELDVPAGPTVVRLRSDARLGTLIRGRLHTAADGRPGRQDSSLGLLAALHPTPAVGGVPRPIALERIDALEAAPRGYWAGAVGWVDADGDGEWVLAIRSVLIGAATARIHAGAGIVAGSVPESEMAETTVKLAPVLEALLPGLSARH